MVMIADLKTREGAKHWRAKHLLAEFIADGKCVFVDGNIQYDTSGWWDKVVVEAYTIKFGNGLLDAPRFTACYCDGVYDAFSPKSMSEYNRSILRKDGETEVLTCDPCSMCTKNTELDVAFIFDIALWRKGTYKTVIEVVDTAPVKHNKRNYCKESGITLIEIRSADVLSALGNGYFKARITRG